MLSKSKREREKTKSEEVIEKFEKVVTDIEKLIMVLKGSSKIGSTVKFNYLIFFFFFVYCAQFVETFQGRFAREARNAFTTLVGQVEYGFEMGSVGHRRYRTVASKLARSSLTMTTNTDGGILYIFWGNKNNVKKLDQN